jgi:hypothetical protein
MAWESSALHAAHFSWTAFGGRCLVPSARSSLRCGGPTAFAQWLASSQQRKRFLNRALGRFAGGRWRPSAAGARARAKLAARPAGAFVRVCREGSEELMVDFAEHRRSREPGPRRGHHRHRRRPPPRRGDRPGGLRARLPVGGAACRSSTGPAPGRAGWRSTRPSRWPADRSSEHRAVQRLGSLAARRRPAPTIDPLAALDDDGRVGGRPGPAPGTRRPPSPSATAPTSASTRSPTRSGCTVPAVPGRSSTEGRAALRAAPAIQSHAP